MKPINLIVLFALTIVVSTRVHAATYCEEQYTKQITSAKADYLPELQMLRSQIKRVQDAGIDPTKYVDELDGQYVPITYKFAVLWNRLENATSRAAGQADGCQKAVAPAQLATDIGVILATGGAALILPEHMTRIEVGQVLNGKPFGSESAVVPKFRDDLIGIATGNRDDNGFISNMIRDPWRCITFQRSC